MKKMLPILIIISLMIGIAACNKPTASNTNTTKEELPLIISQENTAKTDEEKPKEEPKQQEDKNKDNIQPEIKYPDPNSKVPGPIEVKDKEILDTLKQAKFYASIPSYNYFRYNSENLDIERKSELDEAFNKYLKERIINKTTWLFLTGSQFTVDIKNYEVYTLKEKIGDLNIGDFYVVPKVKITNIKLNNVPKSKYEEVSNTIIPRGMSGMKFITDEVIYSEWISKGLPLITINTNKFMFIDELLKYVSYDSPEIKYILNAPDYQFIVGGEFSPKTSFAPLYLKGKIVLIDDNFNPLFWIKYKIEGDGTQLMEKFRESNAKEFIQWAKDNLK